MTDTCSDLAYRSLIAKGKVGHDQLSVLNIFRKMRVPMTCREAFEAVQFDGLDLDFAGVKSRMTELTDSGLLEKYDKQVCKVTGKKVNRWRVKPQPVNTQKDLFL